MKLHDHIPASLRPFTLQNRIIPDDDFHAQKWVETQVRFLSDYIIILNCLQ